MKIRQFVGIGTYGSDFIYRSCDNCGTVDVVPKDANLTHGMIYFTPPFEVRKCSGKDCDYSWAWH